VHAPVVVTDECVFRIAVWRSLLQMMGAPLVVGALAAGTMQIAPLAHADTPTGFTRDALADDARRVATDDRRDFEDAKRGFIATRKDPVVRDAAGEPLFNLSGYDFLKSAAPPTANPSLWRQAGILTMHGLFKVTDGIYQVRGFDVSTVSFIDAGAGWIVVDPLTSVDAARAALELVTEHLGEKPVIAVIYSHSHGDHYGGVLGVTTVEAVQAGKVRIVAPAGFMEHAVSENVIAGPAMSRRARFQFGLTLPRGPDGEMTSGLGPRISRGGMSLIAPTDTITRTGAALTLGDQELVFQLTPETEAPAEMNFYLPARRALFMAENANLTMHNLLPARGALVRDGKRWADYLTEAVRLFAAKSDVLFAAHAIPRFGTASLTSFLEEHRDAYKYLHDQTVRLMNNGYTGIEIAETLQLPEPLAKQWFNRGYYGTMSHNSKAVYQRYMGWYDANPANLNPLPPEPAGKRYVEAMGGQAAVRDRAKAAIDAGDYRWAAMLLNHAVFADATDAEAREMLAGVYSQLGYQAEAGTWRNIYLTGAQELRNGVVPTPPVSFSPAVLAATPTSMLLDFAAVRIDAEKALEQPFSVRVELTDRSETHLLRVRNGVLVHEQDVDGAADATVRLARPAFLMTLLAGQPTTPLIERGEIAIEGDKALYERLVGLVDSLEPNFPIVTP
jgi:alkyl sulfatase BDS1-like metallo-beta-lactamase superfamily hydrolase